MPATSFPRTIGENMTATPATIAPGQPLAAAHELMRSRGIRHLPVMHGGRLVGLVTARDLALVETLRDVDPRTVTVEDAMSQDVFSAPPDAPLRGIVAEMAERKLGCAVVIERDAVVGIFTLSDACRTLALLLDLVGE